MEERRRAYNALRVSHEALQSARVQAQAEEHAGARLATAERSSYERRIAHLTAELESSSAAQEALHAECLRKESDARALRAQLDDAQHAIESERSAAEQKVGECIREHDRLKLQFEHRHSEAVRREAMITRARDEAVAAGGEQQREALAIRHREREEEAAIVKRLQADKARAHDELQAQLSASAASLAAERERLAGALGELASARAELHGLSLEKAAADEEAARGRQRGSDAEARTQALVAQMHALRLEHTETAARAKAADEAQGRLRARLAEASSAYNALVQKVRATRRQWAKERQHLTDAASRANAASRASAASRANAALPRGGEPSPAAKAGVHSKGFDGGETLAGFLREEQALVSDIRAMAQDLRQR